MSLALSWLLDPIALLFLITLFFLVRRVLKRPGVASLLGAIAWVAMVLLMSAPNAVNPLLAKLEDQHVFDPQCQADSIVVLSGGVSSSTSDKSNFQGMSHATFSRVTSAWQFHRQHRDVPVVVTGGPIGNVKEGEVIAEYLLALGLSAQQLFIEAEARNTRQNAENVAQLLRQKDLSTNVWLVTSAAHMPRAQANFINAGLSVCHVPVDYQAKKDLPAIAWMPQTTSLAKFKRWLHEVIAMALT